MNTYALRFESALGAQTIDVMVANSMWTRMRGLLARPELRSGEGMLLRSCNMVHTVGMRYPIDVVFLGRDGSVLKVSASVAPRRARSHWRAHSVLELAAGEAGRRGIGQSMRLPIESMQFST